MSVIKGRPVAIDSRVPLWYLARLSFEKIICFCRGLLKTGKPIFVGKGTSIKNTRLLNVARGVEIANFCQIDCLSSHGISMGSGSKIGNYSIVKVSGSLTDLGDKIRIGNNVAIGDFSHIGGAASVIIGDDTITGAYLSIHPENHNFSDSSVPIRLQGVSRKGVSIGHNCWIGAKVTFLDGSSIGDGTIVAAGAVVTKKFPARVVIGGVPATILKHLAK